jgi:hypothetical protein
LALLCDWTTATGSDATTGGGTTVNVSVSTVLTKMCRFAWIAWVCTFLHSGEGWVALNNQNNPTSRALSRLERTTTTTLPTQTRLRVVPRQRSTTTLKLSYNKENPTYSDDFFGLLFLGSALGVKDVVFSVTFLVLSFVAATLTRRNPTNNNGGYNNEVYDVVRLPGWIALVSWGISLLLKWTLPTDTWLTVPPDAVDDPTAILAEGVACVASFVYTSRQGSK